MIFARHVLPFGELYEDTDPAVGACNNDEPWPYGFTVQYHDVESGLVYMHARYYNPVTGHFMSPDSVVPNPSDTYSYDRYAYCRNNPINLVDPTGHNPLIGAVIGAIVGAIMAAINGQNILVGAAMGALAGAGFAWAGALEHGAFLATIGVGAALGVVNATLYGGNMLEAVFIGVARAAIGYGFGQWGAHITSSHFGQSVMAVMSGGTVGGLNSVAMGGDFWKGFTQGAMAAGLSYAGNVVARRIELSENEAPSSSSSTRNHRSLFGDFEFDRDPHFTYDPRGLERNIMSGCPASKSSMAPIWKRLQDVEASILVKGREAYFIQFLMKDGTIRGNVWPSQAGSASRPTNYPRWAWKAASDIFAEGHGHPLPGTSNGENSISVSGVSLQDTRNAIALWENAQLVTGGRTQAQILVLEWNGFYEFSYNSANPSISGWIFHEWQ